MYIYIYTYIHVYLYMYMYMYINIRINTHTHRDRLVNMYICMYAGIYCMSYREARYIPHRSSL